MQKRRTPTRRQRQQTTTPRNKDQGQEPRHKTMQQREKQHKRPAQLGAHGHEHWHWAPLWQHQTPHTSMQHNSRHSHQRDENTRQRQGNRCNTRPQLKRRTWQPSRAGGQKEEEAETHSAPERRKGHNRPQTKACAADEARRARARTAWTRKRNETHVQHEAFKVTRTHKKEETRHRIDRNATSTEQRTRNSARRQRDRRKEHQKGHTGPLEQKKSTGTGGREDGRRRGTRQIDTRKAAKNKRKTGNKSGRTKRKGTKVEAQGKRRREHEERDKRGAASSAGRHAH
ncbi:hypothetical protein, conserved in T. vivax [Trypanosoma vivax Y486]|uniref:Uncharacterized protein n=1 Tax=Trypanosoma vivax (strain Y486) TaxID=1055687 RepID=F9WQ39_TRYVY|nr:hypothetical protein, conserved in T. vivax [Trypanosoma vivax Y486]|eukprot:CCD19666.1 hypothetical protein, conserved in T. vivax [Trypanosoma vivax Y486]